MEMEPGSQPPPRLPDQVDLIRLCRELNARGAKYLIVGGMAVIQHGFLRATEDIDLLLEASLENQSKVLAALATLPDNAVREIQPGELDQYVVIRVADEFVVDLMLKTCGIDYHEAIPEVETITIQDVPIPFASPKLLLKMKQTYRDKDAIDREFLEQKIRGEV